MTTSNYANLSQGFGLPEKSQRGILRGHWQNPVTGLASRIFQTVYKHQLLMLVFYCTASAYLNYGGLVESAKARRLRLSGKANLCQFATPKLAFESGDLPTSSNGGYSHA